MRFVARVLFSCIEGWFKEKRPETDLIESVSGCTEEIGDDADDGQEPQRQLHLPDKLRNKPQQHHADGAADRARKEARPGLVGTHVRRELLMAEGHTAQHREAVANKRDDERHQDERGRDIAQQRNAAVHRREQKPADDADRDGGKRQRRFLPVRHDCDGNSAATNTYAHAKYSRSPTAVHQPSMEMYATVKTAMSIVSP